MCHAREVTAFLAEDRARFEDVPVLAADVPGAWGPYRGYAELLGDLALRAEEGARASTPGRSVEGEPIVRFELGPTDARGAARLRAGHHPQEWIGVETALALIDALLLAPPARRVVVYPLVNPDGYRRAEANLRAGRFRFVRANANGVDLNRNWPTHFRPNKTFFERLLPFLGTPGAHPGSEPEVRTILDELDASKGLFARAVSLHSFGGMLLLPYGGRFALPPDYPSLLEHARGIGARLGGRYRIRTSARWVPGLFAYGMELDDLHARGIAPILVECAWGQASLFRPSTWLHPWRWFNPEDPARHAAAISAALRPFLLDEPG
jgi:hypothetical protein